MPSRPSSPSSPSTPPAAARRWTLAVAAVALLAGLAGLGWWLLRSPSAPQVVGDADVVPLPGVSGPAPLDVTASDQPGGTFAGTVVDKDDKPIRGATVLLAGTRDDRKVSVPIYFPAALQKDDPDKPAASLQIPEFGVVEVIAPAAKTGPDGRFSLNAGSARAAALYAFEPSHAPGILAHAPPEKPLKPGNDLTIKLLDPGWLTGKVVDAESNDPVRGAEVTIYMQGHVSQDADHPGPTPFTPQNAFSKYQEFLARELGPRVWGLTPQPGDAGLHLYTGGDGTFTLGPLTSEAQLWVNVTHPDYAWTEFDPDVLFQKDNPKPGQPGHKPGADPVARRVRLVVKPGEHADRTYALVKGREVRGRVLDDTSQPLADVDVSLYHVAQYAQHPWYRTRARTGRTDADGRFRIAGLSYPQYNLRMTHPSMDATWFYHVEEWKAGTAVPDYKISAAGWIEGAVDGGPPDGIDPADPAGKRTIGPAYTATLYLQVDASKEPERRLPVLVKDHHFNVEKAEAGRFRAWLQAGAYVSDPVAIEVQPRVGTTLVLRLSSGGTAEIPVTDRFRLPLDPATVDLDRIEPDGTVRTVGRVTSREGIALASALRPGRYRARVSVPRFMPAVGEPFDVAAEKTTRTAAVVVHEPSYVRITSLRDGEGRSLAETFTHTEVASEDGAYEPVKGVEAGLLRVVPGRVRLRARTDDGRSFESTLEVEEGKTVPVDVVLHR